MAAALLAVYILWGSTYLGIRYAIDSLPPFTMAAARFVLAGGLFFLIVRLRTGSPTKWQHWLGALVVGTLMLAIGNGAVVWAEQSVPSGVVAVVVSTSAIWMVVADRALFGVRLHWPQVAGIAVGLVGIVILANPQASVVPVVPALVLVVSAVSWGFGSVLSRRVPMPSSVAMGNGMQMLMGGLVFVLIALAAGEPSRLHPDRVTATSVFALAYLGLAGLIAFTCYMWLIRVAPVVLVSTQSYVSPVVAVLLGAVIRGEVLTPRETIAGAVILAGVVLIASAPLLVSRGRAGDLRAGRAA